MDKAAELIEQIKQSNDTYRKNQCRHTLPEGERCGSPAMRGERFCYYHHQTRKPVVAARQRRARSNAFSMPVPNSRAEIQDGIGRIIANVAGNDIDLRRAGLLLYALQLASTNLTEHQRHHKKNEPEISSASPKPEHPHYGTGPKPEFGPDGEPIFTIQTPQPRSQNSAPDFTPPPARWQRIKPGTGRILLEALGRHYGHEPLPGTPQDRRTAEALTDHASSRAERSGVETSASLPLTPGQPEPEQSSTTQDARGAVVPSLQAASEIVIPIESSSIKAVTLAEPPLCETVISTEAKWKDPLLYLRRQYPL